MNIEEKKTLFNLKKELLKDKLFFYVRGKGILSHKEKKALKNKIRMVSMGKTVEKENE